MAIGPTIKEIREITFALSDKLKMDFSNYAFSFLRRRFAFIYTALKVKNADSLIHDIRSGEVIEEFNYLFPIPVNEMFRDPSFWRTLRVKILPTLNDNLSFWFPELVSAEELFSLLVILQEEKLNSKAKIYCNVNSLKRIDEIKQAKISNKNIDLNKNNFKRLELESKFEDYFWEQDGFIGIQSELLQNVEFIQDNYFNSVPKEDIGVTLFRNRMLYYNGKLQSDAEKQLHQSLNKDAYLVIGIKERIVKENACFFDLYDSGEQIYRVS